MNQTEIICINSKYSQDYLEFYSKWNVKVPVEDKIYTLRDKVLHTTGEWGLRVVEIVNPKFPVESSLLPDAWVEPTFNINRFADLLGNPLEKVKESITDDNLQEHTLKETYNESRGKK